MGPGETKAGGWVGSVPLTAAWRRERQDSLGSLGGPRSRPVGALPTTHIRHPPRPPPFGVWLLLPEPGECPAGRGVRKASSQSLCSEFVPVGQKAAGAPRRLPGASFGTMRVHSTQCLEEAGLVGGACGSHSLLCEMPWLLGQVPTPLSQSGSSGSPRGRCWGTPRPLGPLLQLF